MSSREPAAIRLAQLEELDVEIEKLVAGGEGLARFEGIPLFVPRAAPGDRLRVRLTERRPDYGRAEIVEILRPGPGRREPPCPFFERCGGCDLQHLDDDLQTRLKAEAVMETLVRLGKLERTPEVEVLRGEAWGYRLRTQLQVDTGGLGGAVRVGYHRRGSHELVAVDGCPILVPELERLLPELPAVLDRAVEAGEKLPRRLDLTVGDPERGEATAAPVVEGLRHGEVHLAVGGSTYAYDARTFFQAHRGLVEGLVERVLGADEGETAVDLYAGVGLFTLPLARRYRRVIAVEGDRIAVRFCRNNARRNHHDNIEVIPRAVETWVRELPEGTDRVVVDPPRAGLHRNVRDALLRHGPRRLTYVSCHAATLARDLRTLSRRYRLLRLVFVDLFPQTGHMEVVAQLERLEGDAAESTAERSGAANQGAPEKGAPRKDARGRTARRKPASRPVKGRRGSSTR